MNWDFAGHTYFGGKTLWPNTTQYITLNLDIPSPEECSNHMMGSKFWQC